MRTWADTLGVQVTAVAATRILEIAEARSEIGLSLARALPPEGMLIRIQADRAGAEEFRKELAHAGFADRATVIAADPSRMLHKLAGPFDVIVYGGDGDHLPSVRDRLMGLLRPGGLLMVVADDGSLITYVNE
jgi:predicted O-methyltransferase YrrM